MNRQLPRSATRNWIGLTGAGSLVVANGLLLLGDGDPVVVALGSMAAFFFVVAGLEILFEKSPRHPDTGLDFARLRRGAIDLRRSLVKFIGLMATIALAIGFHWLFRLYQPAVGEIALRVIAMFVPAIFIVSLLYVIVIDAAMVEPEDSYFLVGSLLLLRRLPPGSGAKLREHALSWLVKTLFLPLMFAYLVSMLGPFRNLLAGFVFEPALVARVVAEYAGMLTLCVACVGYLLSLRLLNSHIRSTNPFVASWFVTFICYEPLNLIVFRKVLDYDDGRRWSDWFGDVPVLAWGWVVLIVAAFVLWSWATVIYGLRWSNLTHRGIVTEGPYRFTKHPDYLVKSLFWWLIHVPFLSAAGWQEALHNSLLLLVVNAIYYGRARAEERHLSADPVYVAYATAMNERSVMAPLARLLPWLRYRPPVTGS